ncbi:MAG: superoxide dismutase [Patescibacteria group bacterium]|nr:superoxide dismutase [Patescibacteria group bacterium]
MRYEVKNYEILFGLPGFSDDLFKDHFVLYQGYVSNTNKLKDQLTVYRNEGMTNSSEYAEIKRRFGWEYNGMRLHELYFENLASNSSIISAGSELGKKIDEVFGSFENWQKDLEATAAMRGIGWVVFCRDNNTGDIFNVWVNEHDVGHLVGTTPLLVVDLFEHAYLRDYRIKKADYINSFLRVINWVEVEKRYNK